mmetsp:Transcript_62225/g.166696  ORF Transcript_62225/g.166696 Transcript_62225/m.166696 type:complete len:220 (-) Transcript_62225:409-1068(-)
MVVQLGLHRHDRRGRDGLHQALELIVLPGVCHETFSLSVTGVMKSGLREGKLPLVGGAEVAGILALPRQSLRGLGSEVCELLLVAQTVCLILGLRRLQLPLQPGFVLFAALHGLGQSPTLLLQATEGGHGRVMLPVLHGLQVGHPRSSLREQVPHPTQVLLKLVRPLLLAFCQRSNSDCSPSRSDFSSSNSFSVSFNSFVLYLREVSFSALATLLALVC